MTKKQPASSRSNAANGTKQIWVKNVLHAALSERAKRKGQSIRVAVERMVLQSLGYDTEDENFDADACLEDLEKSLKTGKGTIPAKKVSA